MILLGQWLAERWVARQQARGKEIPITDPALRHRFLMRVLAGLWAISIIYVALGGMERETGARGALGQWLLIFTAIFGWLPILVLFVRRHLQMKAQSDPPN